LAILERLIVTEDGSHSLYSDLFNQQYHSLQGALTESVHIYIELGLRPVLAESEEGINVFEMGFGTGLNALLAWQLADELKKKIHYTSVEAFPVSAGEASLLNYESLINSDGLLKLHTSSWSEDHECSSYFTFRKEHVLLQDYTSQQRFHVIFYDAFDPRAQPELWTDEIFTKIAGYSHDGAVLVTYSSKGIVKRALAAGGFQVKRHKGPGRKTHVLKAVKLSSTQ
jgi:tRNA U34 5-methylaminomethyl-2-thiouridine-forming methyltransferase MnmC